MEEEIYQKRDILMAEMHTDLKYMRKWTENHDGSDEKRFKEVNDKIGWGLKLAIICAIIIVANGGLTAIKTVFNVGG